MELENPIKMIVNKNPKRNFALLLVRFLNMVKRLVKMILYTVYNTTQDTENLFKSEGDIEE